MTKRARIERSIVLIVSYVVVFMAVEFVMFWPSAVAFGDFEGALADGSSVSLITFFLPFIVGAAGALVIVSMRAGRPSFRQAAHAACVVTVIGCATMIVVDVVSAGVFSDASYATVGVLVAMFAGLIALGPTVAGAVVATGIERRFCRIAPRLAH